MKILMLYSPRSGTNSICEYFLKQNTNYTYFNQPWSPYQEKDRTLKKAKYVDCLQYDNVLVKSEITAFEKLKISYNNALLDFDKIILMSRKNKKEQAISYITAESNKNFLSKNKRKYFIESITESQIEMTISYLDKCDTTFEKLSLIGGKQFYYEDLYYNNFDEIFKFLEIKFIEEDFENSLNIKNKYFSGEWESKKRKSII